MEDPPQKGPPKFKNFNHSRKTHEIFRIEKNKSKIKYNKIWGYQNREGSPLNETTKIQPF